MTQEDKQLLLKDISARLPYSVVIRCTDSDTDYKCFLTTDILHEIQNGYEYYDYKPYLRPMSSMTEEEEVDFTFIWEDILSVGKDDDTCILSVGQIDWLNAHYFDYRGLISKGLAIEAPEDMYKIE